MIFSSVASTSPLRYSVQPKAFSLPTNTLVASSAQPGVFDSARHCLLRIFELKTAGISKLLPVSRCRRTDLGAFSGIEPVRRDSSNLVLERRLCQVI